MAFFIYGSFMHPTKLCTWNLECLYQFQILQDSIAILQLCLMLLEWSSSF